MYEVSKEIRENIKDAIIEELNERNYYYTDAAIDTILDEWYAQKNGLMELLSKHPNWSPEELMIRFDKDFNREINVDEAYRFINWLHNNTTLCNISLKRTPDDPDYHYWYNTIRTLHDSMCYILTKSTFLDGENPYVIQELECLNKMHEDFKFRPGQKVTKIMRKICATYGWDKIMRTETLFDGSTREYNAFEREYAKYCDAMCPIKVIRHTCISVNPLDYLLMSNGNSWNSCHDIGESGDSGCYSSGTISYMLDKHSLVFYTVDGSYNGDEISRQCKIQRQIFGYNDNQLLQSRLYPQSNDNYAKEIYTDIRNIMQKVIADCEGKPNLWVKRKVQNVRKGVGATLYDDWKHFPELCCVSVFSDCAEKELEAIKLGEPPICVNCGERHDEPESIDCCYGGRHTCVDCGRRIDEDDVIWVNDEPYCYSCVRYCAECGEYYRHDEVTWVEFEGMYVCDDCLSENYVWCKDVRTYVNEYHATYIECEDEYVTNRYRNEHYEQCRDCGEWFKRDEMKKATNEYGEVYFYCEECYEENEEAC